MTLQQAQSLQTTAITSYIQVPYCSSTRGDNLAPTQTMCTERSHDRMWFRKCAKVWYVIPEVGADVLWRGCYESKNKERKQVIST